MSDSLATLEVKLDASGAASSTDLLAAKLDNLDKQNQSVTASTAGLTAGQKLVNEQIISAAIGLSRLDVTNLKHVELVQQMIAKETERAAALGATAGQLAQLQSLQASYDAQLGISTQKMDLSGAGLGRLRQGFTSLFAQMSGTMPILDRTIGTFASMALGTGPALAVIAGLAAIAFGFDKITAAMRGTTAQQEELIKKLEDGAKANAAGGVANQTLTATQNKVSGTVDTIGVLAYIAAESNGWLNLSGIFQTFVASKQKLLKQSVADEVLAASQVDDLEQKQAQASVEHFATQLGAILSSGKATAQERANALVLYKSYEADYAKLNDGDIAMKADLLKVMDELRSGYDKLTDAENKKLLATQTAIKWGQDHIAVVHQESLETALLAQLATAAAKALLQEDIAGATVKALPYINNVNANPTIALQTTGIGDGSAQAAKGATDRVNAANAAAQVLDDKFRTDQYNAWKKWYEDLEKAGEETQKNMLREMQRDASDFFDTVLSGGTDSFGKLWKEVKSGFTKLISDLLASDLMKQLAQSFPSTFGQNTGTSGLPAGIGALTPSSSFLSIAAPYAAGLAIIGSSIIATAQANAQAAAQFQDSTITWQASFKTLQNSFGETDFEKQKDQLASQFQQLADTAITSAATAISNEKATWNLGTKGRDNTTIPGSLDSMDDLDSYIQSLTAAQGSGKNVAQDRDMATLLDQLTQLDDEYKKQALAVAANISAQQGLYQQDLKVRQLTAEGDTADATALQRRLDEDAQVKAAQDAGYDDATVALLKQVQAEEDLKTAADAAAASAAAAAAASAASAAAIAKAQADAATAMAAMATRLNDFTTAMGDSVTNLGVRLLKAQGDATAADALAFKLQQDQEMRAAQAQAFSIQQEIQADQAQIQKNNLDSSVPGYLIPEGGGYVVDKPANDALLAAIAALDTMAQGQADYIAQLAIVQAAEAAAFAANPSGSSLPAASAAAGTSGSFNTVVSQATAQQADQMVDSLASMLILLSTYLPQIASNTANLGPKLNRYLGKVGQQTAALAGAGAVT